jgi:hypothetical protein
MDCFHYLVDTDVSKTQLEARVNELAALGWRIQSITCVPATHQKGTSGLPTFIILAEQPLSKKTEPAKLLTKVYIISDNDNSHASSDEQHIISIHRTKATAERIRENLSLSTDLLEWDVL